MDIHTVELTKNISIFQIGTNNCEKFKTKKTYK